MSIINLQNSLKGSVVRVKIIKQLVDKSKYNLKCPYTMKPTRIVVHNTANDASARNEVYYMTRNSSSTGFHYAVDDKEIVQGIPENRNAFHAGDGNKGKGNREGLSIEICYSKSGGERFARAEKLTASFIASKLKEYGWGIDKITKHQDYSGKYCPHRTLDLGWKRFLSMIEKELAVGVSFVVRIEATELNYRAGAGVSYPIKGQVRKGEVFTIVETSGDWGKLKSGAGWINLKYTEKLS